MNRICRLTVLAALVALVGCTTTDPYTGEQRTGKTGKGAAIGAIAGAVLGAATSSSGDRGKGVLTGAAAGGAIGGGIGYYMDKQEQALRDQLQGTGVRVVRDGNSIRLVMPGQITFGVDRHELRPEFYDTLESVSLVLQEYDKTNIRIAGYTDSTGSDSYNQTLSEKRAASVGEFLRTRGVASGRIWTTGYGERHPIADNDTEEGRQRNRRVELELVPVES